MVNYIESFVLTILAFMREVLLDYDVLFCIYPPPKFILHMQSVLITYCTLNL
jgi:hypothetical protein